MNGKDEPQGNDELEDFSADDLYNEDLGEVTEDTPVEEWDETYSEEMPDTAPAPVQKKKIGRNLSANTLVIIIAVVLGFGVLVWTVLVSAPPTSSTDTFASGLTMNNPATSSLLGESPAPASETGTPAASDPSRGGFLDNPESLTERAPSPQMPQVVENAPPMPAPIAGSPGPEALTPMPGSAESSTELEVSETEAAPVPRAPEETFAKVDDFMKAGPVPELPAPAAAPVEEMPAAVSAPADPGMSNTQAEKLMEAIDAMAERFDALAVRMNGIESKMVNMRPAPAGAAQPDEETLKRLGEIEDTLAGLARKINAAPVADASAPAPRAEANLESVEAPSPKAALAPKPAPAKAVVPALSAPAPTPVRWELRAAQPDRAWVSRPGEKEMRLVKVGDSLPGLGKITAITYAGNLWTVQGTQGKITQ